MTSAILPANPFQPLAQAKTITPELVKEVIASVPKELGLTENDVYRELKEIVFTNIFEGKLPQLSDEVKARMGAAAPADKASPLNSLAAGLEEALSPPPRPGKIWENAHALSAAVTGAVVSLRAELAEKTDEQKADKKAIIDSFQDNVVGLHSLQLYAGLWAALAKPTGQGDFSLQHDEVEALTASMRDGEFTPELNTILKSRLAPEAAGPEGADGEAEPADAASKVEAAKAKREHELTRPVGGKSTEELEAIYKDVTAQAHIGQITYRPETFRTEKYQKILNALNESPFVEYLKPILKDYIGRINVNSRRAEKANFTEISPENKAHVTDKQLIAMKKVADRIAARLGGGEASLTRRASDILNAWVSSIDMAHPHANYYSHLQDIVWDGVKGDWLKFYVGPDGKECAADAPGAKEVSGEALCEVVLAHEFNHINEQAVYNQFLLSILLGVNLSAAAATGHADGCLCSGCGGSEEQLTSFNAMLADPAVKSLTSDPRLAADRQRLVKALGIEELVSNAQSARKALDEDAKLPAKERTMTEEQRAAARASADALDDFFLMFTREGESTADYGAIRTMGPDAPKWMAMAFDIVTRSSGKGSPEERLQQLKESYFRDQRADAEYNLSYSEENGAISHAQYQVQTTHPTRILRAIANFDYAESDGAKAVWAFENRNVRARLLGAAQAVDSEIERLEDEHSDFQHGTQDHMAPEETMKTVERAHNRSEIRGLYERMRLVTAPIAKLIFDDGLPKEEGGDTPYCVHVGQFMKLGGEPIFRHKGDSNPLAALLGGGGGGGSPACVKMAGQLADELQKIVDAATLPDADHEGWMEVIAAYRAIAQDGNEKGETARKQRLEGKVAARALRRSLA